MSILDLDVGERQALEELVTWKVTVTHVERLLVSIGFEAGLRYARGQSLDPSGMIAPAGYDSSTGSAQARQEL